METIHVPALPILLTALARIVAAAPFGRFIRVLPPRLSIPHFGREGLDWRRGTRYRDADGPG